MNKRYWNFLNKLINEHPIVIDRPAGSHHPDFDDLVYPLDYGYLEGTYSMDGGGIDIWMGKSNQNTISGVLCIIDLKKSDSEIKIVFSCNDEEIKNLKEFHNSFSQAAIWIENPNL
ncbi:MAG: hypothetical protein BGO78_08180 [Chloroflexi bacterium 44-23]|nr:MAG: hypothetical protein BGO78_08180 [Chloroflexi bacterium 44-23]